MSGSIVPADDLPGGLVPTSDLPDSPPAAPQQRGAMDIAKDVGRFALTSAPPFAALKAGPMIDKAAYDAGGAVTDALAKVNPQWPEVAAGAGYLTNLGVQALPVLAGGSAGQAAQPAFQAAGRRLMTSALKPDKAARESGKGAEAVDTLLETGTNVTKGGVQELTAEIDKLNAEIKAAIARSPATVDKAQAAQVLDQLTDRFKMQVTPQSDLATVQKALQDFLNHPLLAQISDIPVQLAQELKQGTYKALGSKSYGELKGADTEAQKALARGLKEGIASAVPEVAPLNAAESKLINARDLAQERVLAADNRNLVGLGWAVHNPMAFLGWLTDRSPLATSVLARGLYSGSSVLPTAGGATLGAVAGAYSGRPGREPVRAALSNPAVSQQLGVPPFVAQPLPGRDRGPGMTGARG